MHDAVWHRVRNERISTSAQVGPVLGIFCCSFFMWFVLELPPSQLVPYSVPNGICGPFFIIIPYYLFLPFFPLFQLCPEPKRTPISGLKASLSETACVAWNCHQLHRASATRADAVTQGRRDGVRAPVKNYLRAPQQRET
jgi:hypothetical protein